MDFQSEVLVSINPSVGTLPPKHKNEFNSLVKIIKINNNKLISVTVQGTINVKLK